jgi:hypothetical protein
LDVVPAGRSAGVSDRLRRLAAQCRRKVLPGERRDQLGVVAEAIGPDAYDPKGEREQFHALLGKKPTGIAVSGGDPASLKGDIDAAIAQGIPVVTMDSDVPDSKRLFFIGTDNYKAGLMGGRLVANHLNGKGNVMIFTFPEQPNLKERLQGYRDIFAEHPGIHISEIVDAKGDPGVIFDRTMQVVDKNEAIDAFVCLVSIAAPEVADVLTRKGVKGKLVMGMDSDQRWRSERHDHRDAGAEAFHHGLPGHQDAGRIASPSASLAVRRFRARCVLASAAVRRYRRDLDRQEQRGGVRADPEGRASQEVSAVLQRRRRRSYRLTCRM